MVLYTRALARKPWRLAWPARCGHRTKSQAHIELITITSQKF